MRAFLFISLVLLVIITTGVSLEYGDLGFRIIPMEYDITVEPFLTEHDSGEKGTFEGKVSILLKTTDSNVQEISLHAVNLTIRKSSLKLKGGDSNLITQEEPSYNNATSILTYKLKEGIAEGKELELLIEYNGILHRDMKGPYLSSYTQDGQEKTMVVTQFQDSYARRFVPCFDHPEFKAIFRLTIIRRKNMLSWANMPAVAKEAMNGTDLYIDRYEPTPIISSYLLCFLVAEYQEKQIANATEPSFYVISRPDMIQYAEYAGNVGNKMLKHFEQIFGFPYKKLSGKIHLAALPDFNAGAMENPGLVTFRESLMIYHPQKTTLQNKQLIAAIVAHELAHMWFGNIVTCRWWSYTWLNEGFAAFFQRKVIPGVEETTHFEDLFTVDALHGAFKYDSNPKTPPMTNRNVKTLPQIRKMFSPLSYHRGASVIRMLEHYVRRENFYTGLQKYIEKRQFKIATPQDLLVALRDTQETQDVKEELTNIFESFTTFPGYPAVFVHVNEYGRSASVYQKRFFALTKATVSKDLWSIPITYITKEDNDTRTRFTLNREKIEVNLTSPLRNEWIIFNANQVGYYRVSYDEEMWRCIIKALKSSAHDGIPVIHRAQIVDDLMALGKSGDISYTLVFDMCTYLREEREYIPWKAALENFDFIYNRLPETRRQVFRNYIKFLTRNVYRVLGFRAKLTGETPLNTLHRGLILTWACRLGYDKCINEASMEFDLNRKNPQHVLPVDTRQVVFCVGVRHGGKEDFERLWKRYVEENVESEKVTLLSALGCTKNEHIVAEYLERIFSQHVKDNLKFIAFTQLVSYNHENINHIWSFVRKNHEKMSNLLPGGYENVMKCINLIVERMTTQEQHEELKSFIKLNGDKFGNYRKGLDVAEEKLQSLLQWDRENVDEIVKHLRNSAVSYKLTITKIIIIAAVILICYRKENIV